VDSPTFPSVNASLGTVWRVKESLWKERIFNYDQSSKREMHFGVSVQQMPSLGVGFVPMLHGSSEESAEREIERTPLLSLTPFRHKLFYASGLSSRRDKNGNEYRTYFGHLTPALLPTEEIGDDSNVEKTDLDFAWTHDCLRIRRNAHKSRLAPPEKAHLIRWLNNFSSKQQKHGL
jgi:hypothetical protein